MRVYERKPCRLCVKPARYRKKRLCHTHYEKLRRSGTLKYRTPNSALSCKAKDCTASVLARRCCRNHYMKLKRTGTLARFRTKRVGWSRADHHRLSRYGIMPEEYAQNLALQENRCEICKEKFLISKFRHQDHDHKTGQVRALLCRGCNIVIGVLEKKKIAASFYDDYLDDWKFYAEEPSQQK